MIKRLCAALLIASGILISTCVAAGERGLLWRVVQSCLADHALTGAAFPCLAVQTPGGVASGYAVLRSPLDTTHVIVTPTVRTIGIEAEGLRATAAPNYFADAWSARHYVTDALGQTLERADLALAVNSRPGRSQDQLHIHVDCVRPAMRQALARQEPALRPRSWMSIKILNAAPRYWTSVVQSEDLAGISPFELVAKGLRIDAGTMHEWTIVVAGAQSVDGKPGFFVLARQLAHNGHDIAHGEALLDHDCRGYAAAAR